MWIPAACLHSVTDNFTITFYTSTYTTYKYISTTHHSTTILVVTMLYFLHEINVAWLTISENTDRMWYLHVKEELYWTSENQLKFFPDKYRASISDITDMFSSHGFGNKQVDINSTAWHVTYMKPAYIQQKSPYKKQVLCVDCMTYVPPPAGLTLKWPSTK